MQELEAHLHTAASRCHVCGSSSSRNISAAGCPPPTSFCKGCRTVRYCGREHQKEAWDCHQVYCKEHAPIDASNEHEAEEYLNKFFPDWYVPSDLIRKSCNTRDAFVMWHDQAPEDKARLTELLVLLESFPELCGTAGNYSTKGLPDALCLQTIDLFDALCCQLAAFGVSALLSQALRSPVGKKLLEKSDGTLFVVLASPSPGQGFGLDKLIEVLSMCRSPAEAVNSNISAGVLEYASSPITPDTLLKSAQRRVWKFACNEYRYGSKLEQLYSCLNASLLVGRKSRDYTMTKFLLLIGADPSPKPLPPNVDLDGRLDIISIVHAAGFAIQVNAPTEIIDLLWKNTESCENTSDIAECVISTLHHSVIANFQHIIKAGFRLAALHDDDLLSLLELLSTGDVLPPVHYLFHALAALSGIRYTFGWFLQLYKPVDSVRAMMIADPTADLMACDGEYECDKLLSVYVLNGEAREVAALVRLGANPDVSYGGEGGQPSLPLADAIEASDLPTVCALVEVGANVNLPAGGPFGHDPLAMRAIRKVYDPDGPMRTCDGLKAQDDRPKTVPVALALVRARPDLSRTGAYGMNYLHVAGLAAEPLLMAELLAQGDYATKENLINGFLPNYAHMWYDGSKI